MAELLKAASLIKKVADMYRPKTVPHQEKDVSEKDILAPRIPANLSVRDLSAGSFNEDDVISVCRAENSIHAALSTLISSRQN